MSDIMKILTMSLFTDLEQNKIDYKRIDFKKLLCSLKVVSEPQFWSLAWCWFVWDGMAFVSWLIMTCCKVSYVCFQAIKLGFWNSSNQQRLVDFFSLSLYCVTCSHVHNFLILFYLDVILGSFFPLDLCGFWYDTFFNPLND